MAAEFSDRQTREVSVRVDSTEFLRNGAGLEAGSTKDRIAQMSQGSIFYPVAEKFISINGEGAQAGKLAAFIRFAGCNLKCSYCDTKWAQDADVDCMHESLADLVEWVSRQSCSCVTLTGGEPTLQPDLLRLIEALCALEKITVVEIETNGSTDLSVLAAWRSNAAAFEREKLRFTMDYKLPSSGMEARMRIENFELLEPADVVKFVIGSEEDLQAMLCVVRESRLEDRCKVYLSPVFGSMDPAIIVEFMKGHALEKATLQLQLHKIIWPNEDKGV